MKLIIKITSLVVLLCATVVATVVVVKKMEAADSKGPQITSAFVEQQINEISELATLHHHYRKNANYQDTKILLKYMPDWRINKSVKELIHLLAAEGNLTSDVHSLTDLEVCD